MANALALHPDPGYEYGDVLPLRRRKAGGGVELALPNFAREVWNAATDALQLPGDALAGRVDPLSPEGKQRVAEMGLTLAGAGRGLSAPEGALGVFAGRRAQTADLKALAQAMNMEGRKPPEHIWDKTGWFRDVDGKWKFEVSDRHSELSGIPVSVSANMTRLSQPMPLEELMRHPDLFAAYPQLKTMPIVPDKSGFSGSYLPGVGEIHLANAPEEEFHSTALHEIQHAVQDIEGFAQGGSPAEFLPPGHTADFIKTVGEMRNLKSELRGHGIDGNAVRLALMKYQQGLPISLEQAEPLNKLSRLPNLFDKFQDLHFRLIPMEKAQETARQSYMRLAGEVEARNVEERFAGNYSELNPPLKPWQTPGYTPRGEQIVRFPEGWDSNASWSPLDKFHFQETDLDPFAGKP